MDGEAMASKTDEHPEAALLEHCCYCFEALLSHFNGCQAPLPTFEDAEYPLFVTWTVSKNDQLRGCIGNFSPMPLHSGLKEYALTSALQDTRFSPIQRSDLAHLTCGVSLLINFENGANWQDWKIGKHGIRIAFEDENGRKRSATYLPEVAEEQGWDHIQAIDSLLRKGGYRGTITPKVRESIILTRYQSSKKRASYDQYVQHKNRTSSGH
ncbi:hypothetical protein BASA60_008248 [Batrachochytrium salamandrivorans]|nr:hypothetical protein BASA60_008248 [Batrachochytrium salamandrivorans]KAH6572305.1 hypothetical protein BASA62_003454 [Batrachochytrium salamandrivorans]KAH9250197.1 hypothetical protein BASA81_012005 [Batrachochytrium salamandrivorans]